MDPPWPNKSVARGKKSGGGHYDVADSMWHLRQLLFDVDVAPMLAERGVVAVWITNRPSVRELVLSEEDGLFSSWGVKLVEEWIWVKVTERGEPVLPVEGIWRKPYEVLLIGRKSIAGTEGNEAQGEVRDVKRRVIFAVPDIHSRKPCLKQELQRVFALPDTHRGLEIFARYIVSGWTSWGNEVLKFNDVDCWTKVDGDENKSEEAS
ncbi:hypothetical protein CAC42_6146 [Sphaceloma murrayae]|uniref:Uncharacterized protein n=1 Tax=Sphaceloma murrayae TaxID=2082308 RepID=A0A2K1QTI8_9PEZI|nr:hypothetical protein CAC42_6146 [Sphaceloma murrayae]